MVLLSLLPQIHLWKIRGREWNGAYVSSQGDEFLYSAYINALIEGRTRKNDPFAGRDNRAKSPLPESAFSIQFIPPYVISFLARIFGSSASTAMIALIAVAGFFGSLSVFWLLKAVVGDYRVATAGTFFVLCVGGLAGGGFYPTLPFLRRYQPAAAFSLFFVFNVLVWYSFTSPIKRRARISLILAGVTLGVLIFSYLYLWTAAIAWLGCLGLLWFFFRPSERRRAAEVLTTIGITTALALLPYGYLVFHRSPSLDEQQTLASTRQLDLLQIPEVVGVLILVALALGVWRRKFQVNEPRVIYAASLALFPFVVFNQQVLTGKSMQPHHFALFVANYAVLLGVVLCLALLWKTISSRMLIWIVALSFSLGLIEVGLPSRLATVPTAVANDGMVPVLQRLKEVSTEDDRLAFLRGEGRPSMLVFSPNVSAILILPTWTSQGTLLDMGGLDFGSVSSQERKRFFYMHLYYSKADAQLLRSALKGATDNIELNYYAQSVIFGHERVLDVLSYHYQPIQDNEIEREVQNYQAYIDSFSRDEVMKRPIGYAIIPDPGNFDFTNLDLWYERDGDEQVGAYTLYRLRLRN